jgi:hypothetical protein
VKKLNKDNRWQITKAVLAHAFADRIIAFLAEEKALQTAIIDRIYPAEVQQKMRELIEFSDPIQPFETYSHLTIAVCGKRLAIGQVREHFDAKSTRIQFESLLDMVRFFTKRPAGEEWPRTGKGIPVLARHHSSYNELLSVDDSDELGKRAEAYWEEREAIAATATQQRAQIMGVLAHIKTDAQLKAKWPEIMPIAEKFLVEEVVEKVQLPAIITAEFNAALKLPPSNDDVLELTEVAA